MPGLTLEALEDQLNNLRSENTELRMELNNLRRFVSNQANLDNDKFDRLAKWFENDSKVHKEAANSIIAVGNIVKEIDDRITSLEVTAHAMRGK